MNMIGAGMLGGGDDLHQKRDQQAQKNPGFDLMALLQGEQGPFGLPVQRPEVDREKKYPSVKEFLNFF